MYKVNKWCVYKHTNKVNGKIYIGITSKTPTTRWESGHGYRHNKHFTSASKKYGWDNFEHEILSSGLTREEASKMEKDLIAKYKSTDRRFGYNKELGGFEKKGVSDETRKYMSERWLGANNPNYKKKWTEEERKHLSELNSGKNHPKWGTHHSEETRKKISLRLKGENNHMFGKKQSPEFIEKRVRKMRKPVRCIETGVVYGSIREAEENTGIPNCAISQVCNGKQSHARGYHWEFVSKEVI